jgi:hypothetical protein
MVQKKYNIHLSVETKTQILHKKKVEGVNPYLLLPSRECSELTGGFSNGFLFAAD